jgi:lipopolysaccharide transport system ATP-binding protein
VSDIAIRADGLSKQYRIGGKRERYKTLRDSITDTAAAPFRLARSLLEPRRRRTNGDQTIWALQDVGFEIRRGEVVGIIGRNGAGKSTLLKILSRITEPTRGYAEIHGRVGSLLEVGTGFHPELTGQENTYLNGAILGMRRTEVDRKFDEIVAFAEVERFIHTPVKHYSSGMYLRLAFAVAAHLEPEILLVDEVLAVGDAAFQQKCLGKMGDVAKQGRTVLFVSHNMAAVQNMCSAAYLVHDGQLVRSGATEEVVLGYLQMQRNLSAAVTLRDHASRAGTGRLRFTSLEFRDARGEMSDHFLPGEPITMRVTFEAFEEVRHLVIGVTLETVNGLKVCNMRTEESMEIPRLAVGEHTAEVRFSLDRFLGNTFLVNLGAMSAGAEQLDFAHDAGRIVIAPTDVSGSGKTRQRGEILYVPATWTLA